MFTKTSKRITHETCGMIDTERLILRRHTLQDTDLVFQLASDRAVLQSIGGGPPSREDAWHRLLRYAGHWSLLGFGMFAVVERATHQFIGEVGLADFQRGLGGNFDGVPEAAWVFTGQSHGKGFALEAMTAALDWFDRQAVSSRSVCMIEPSNTASIRLAEKLGFTCFDQGCYRHHHVNKYERMRRDT
jgi:RimJ/RimL family protein N-acetyltransferase